MNIYKYLLDTIKDKGGAYLILIDPDNIEEEKLPLFIRNCEQAGVDGFLIGGSLMLNSKFDEFIENVKIATNLPAIIFPGGVNQISNIADAILYLSVVSGRNAEHLIGKHVLAAPIIKGKNIEPISTGYILIESGTTTTVQYMSGTLPIPRNKPEIVAATALAAEYLGMKLIYLEAGSGAEISVPEILIQAVASQCSIPIIVGGGIKSVESIKLKMESGADIIVTGNYFEDENNWELLKDFASAVHTKLSVTV